MILTCTSCDTRYSVDGSKFPAAGRTVRCAKCGVFLPKADALKAPDGYRCREPGCLPKP